MANVSIEKKYMYVRLSMDDAILRFQYQDIFKLFIFVNFVVESQ